MANLVNSIVQSRTVKRLRENKELIKSSKLVGGVLVVFLLSTLPEYSKPSMSPLSSELQAIDKSLKEARTKTDPFVRERFVQQEAKRLGLTSDDYRKLFAIRKKDSAVLPDAPAGLPSKVVWFYQDLSRGQRLQLVGQGGKWLLGVLPNLTILFVGVRFLMEIPQREKEAKYQAWQVVHTAHGQTVSGARIAALEDLHAQGESLRRLTLEAGVVLSGINLARADLCEASFRSARLFEANLKGVHLEGADLSYACLQKATLSGADLHGAELRGADLRLAKLEGANFRGAVYDKQTTFPQGFDPTQHDMVLARSIEEPKTPQSQPPDTTPEAEQSSLSNTDLPQAPYSEDAPDKA